MELVQWERVLTCLFLQKIMESLLFTRFFPIMGQITDTCHHLFCIMSLFWVYICQNWNDFEIAIAEHWNSLEITETKWLWEGN